MGECFFVCYDSVRNELSCRVSGSVSQHAFGLQNAAWKRHDKQPAHERRRKRLQQQRHADSALCLMLTRHNYILVNKLYLFLSFAYTHTRPSTLTRPFLREDAAGGGKPWTSLWLIGRVCDCEGSDASNPETNKSPQQKKKQENKIKKLRCEESTPCVVFWEKSIRLMCWTH